LADNILGKSGTNVYNFVYLDLKLQVHQLVKFANLFNSTTHTQKETSAKNRTEGTWFSGLL